MLRKLEDRYNIAHRSDIHVTGTLSIVFGHPTENKHIMNKNYFDNIHYKDQTVEKDDFDYSNSFISERIIQKSLS